MKLLGKNILLISPEPWDHIFVSKHHYAIHLGQRGNKVFFVNPPGKSENIKQTSFSNVFEINYTGFPTGLRYYPAVLQRTRILSVYRRLEKVCRVSFDVIWSFDNSVFYDFSSLPERVLKISHIVDSNQDFQTSKAARTADICLSVTAQMQNTLSRYNAKSYKINHGFSVAVEGQAHESLRTPAIRAVYAGNLCLPYIDWKIIGEVVEGHPQIKFVFIGPNATGVKGPSQLRRDKEKVLSSENVFSAGRMTSDKVQQFYKSSDLLFVAYQEKYHRNQVANTHKMMEYLGSGKIVVATKTAEYANFCPLIAMSDKNSEWPGVFSEVVRNLTYYNSAELQARRIAFALDNTYEQQIQRVERIITKNLEL